VGRNVKRLEAVHAKIEAAGGAEATIAPFDLEKAVASVTPNAASKTYGTADPALTGTLTNGAAFAGRDAIRTILC